MAPQAIQHNAGSTDEPFPKEITETVQTAMRVRGYDVSLIALCQPPKSWNLPHEAGITPAFITDGTDTSEIIRNGVAFPFSVENELDGYFGESSGSANVTTLFNKLNMAIDDVIEKFHVTGQIEAGREKVKPYVADGVNPIDVTGFAIATYAKGWLAERILSEQERFSKGSVSQDQGGLDLYDRQAGDWVQVKCVTDDTQNDGYVYYQWDCRGGLHFGENRKEVNRQAAKVTGMPLTALYRTHNNHKIDGRRWRYLWW